MRNVEDTIYTKYRMLFNSLSTILSVYPMQVGMNRPKPFSARETYRLSHASGNESKLRFSALRHTRVYPTQVGMNRTFRVRPALAMRLSHASGNDLESTVDFG